MKSSLVLTVLSALAAAVRATVIDLESRATGGYVQNPSGTASFTVYSGCSTPACGKSASGFTAAISQLAFGAPPGLGAGDGCGRCFRVTGTADPYSPSYTGPFNSVVVKVTNLCPVQGNEQWCGQTISKPTNSFNKAVHFDLCQESGASGAFFPSGRNALTGSYQEVSCSQWSGSDGPSLWNGACLSGESAANWPSVACGNQGAKLSPRVGWNVISAHVYSRHRTSLTKWQRIQKEMKAASHSYCRAKYIRRRV
ncbi:RlpA-like double-psi beta-barrel-protein domain-containing protein-containing protein [Multifurca ochricompacta]|uniref:RlpA-like double-psi beta-barrel-protein domain-containing protein-containing protein n=1 Tax=Multifurca ochricompacta TaxID=376703 RepID=A0AAD4LVH1_9AGAM|nr:RlpA-like double-psi beta-barrel-protein domain-containing protein-containing protein [Multifurca ochricompacta]